MKLKLAFFSLFLLLCLSNFVNAQNRSDEEIVKSIAKQILDNTTRDFVVPGTGQILTSVDERNYQPTVKIRSPYNTWNYWNGVLNLAMLDMFQYFGDATYRDFSVKNYEFVYKNIAVFQSKYKPSMDKWSYPFGQFIVTRELDDCGAMGGGLIEVYRLTGNGDYRPYIDKAANHILNGQERLDDGTLVRSGPRRFTLWGDDLYMSIVFLARMGSLTGDSKYFDDAARQVINFTKYLYNPQTRLYYHGWYSDIRQNNVAHWGRCNGWVMLAQTELLRYLPANHPQRDTLLAILQQQVIGVSRYQSQTGLWHQLIDKSDSYLETSCTAMFTYSIAKAVNNGWLDKRYASIAVQGWKGLKSKVQSDGQVQDICIGTGMEDNLVFYYDRPRQLNDIHGLGAVLMAGLEMLKMK